MVSVICRINKSSNYEKTVRLRTEYTNNSILISPEEILLLSNNGNLVFSKGEKSRNNGSLDIRYNYHKPYLQIYNEEGKLIINSMYFLAASTSDFYSSRIDKGNGSEEEHIGSIEELEQELCNSCGYSAFYILNNQCQLLTAANLIDGVIQNDFDIKKAVKKDNPRDNRYDYMLISSIEENIDAKFFSIRSKGNTFILKTKKIPIHQIGIYDVAEEASDKELENIDCISTAHSEKKALIKRKDK